LMKSLYALGRMMVTPPQRVAQPGEHLFLEQTVNGEERFFLLFSF